MTTMLQVGYYPFTPGTVFLFLLMIVAYAIVPRRYGVRAGHIYLRRRYVSSNIDVSSLVSLILAAIWSVPHSKGRLMTDNRRWRDFCGASDL